MAHLEQKPETPDYGSTEKKPNPTYFFSGLGGY